MKATGLIVEYNPFHNGHLYHLKQSLKQSQGAGILLNVANQPSLTNGNVQKWL